MSFSNNFCLFLDGQTIDLGLISLTGETAKEILAIETECCETTGPVAISPPGISKSHSASSKITFLNKSQSKCIK